MTKEEFWEKFLNDEVDVHTPKKEQYLAFLKICEAKEIPNALKESMYDRHKEDTCVGILTKSKLPITIQFICDLEDTPKSWLAISTLSKSAQYSKVVEFDEIFEEEKTTEEKEVVANLNAKLYKDNTYTKIEAEGNAHYLAASACAMLGALHDNGLPKKTINEYLEEAFKNE